MEFKLRFCRKPEKCLCEGGISDLMVSAVDVKKLLKELATVSGSDVTVSPIEIDIGDAVLFD